MMAMNNPAIWTSEVLRRYKEFMDNPGDQYASCGVSIVFLFMIVFDVFVAGVNTNWYYIHQVDQ